MDRWTDKRIYQAYRLIVLTDRRKYTEGQTDGQTDGQYAEGQMDKQADRQSS